MQYGIYTDVTASNRVKNWTNRAEIMLEKIVNEAYLSVVKEEIGQLEYEALKLNKKEEIVEITETLAINTCFVLKTETAIYPRLSEKGRKAGDLLTELRAFRQRYDSTDHNNRKRIFEALFSSKRTGSSELKDFFEELI